MSQDTLTALFVQDDCNEVIQFITQALSAAGFSVTETFDFQNARAAHSGCTCPNHGTERCTCQMVELLIYNEGIPPVTLTIHGDDMFTELVFASSPAPKSVEKIKLSALEIIEPLLLAH